MKLANAETSSRTAACGVSVGLDVSSGYPVPVRFRQFDGSPVRPLPPLPSSPGSGRSCVNSSLRDPHLHVVGLTGKDVQRLVLRLPAETGDRAVVTVVVEGAGNAKIVVEIRCLVLQQG